MNIKKINISPKVYYSVFIVLLFSVYYKLIIKDPLLSYDDRTLIDPIAHMNSIAEYFSALFKGYILDVQPLRDLSFAIDLKLIKVLPFYSFHLTNVLLWIIICVTFKKILNFYSNSTYLAWAFFFFLAFSPVAASSVAWVAARKHLLSTLFIMLSTFLVITTEKFNFKIGFTIVLLFIFSCASHPINALWPAWTAIYCYRFKLQSNTKRSIIILLLFLGLVTLAAVYINTTYYEGMYTRLTGATKYDAAAFNSISLPLLALGRYFYLTIFPFDSLPSSHYEGAWQNLAGLLMLPIFLYLILKISDKEKLFLTLSFVLFFFLPLIPVTVRITNVYCSDTYLLTASIGIYLAIFLNLVNRWRSAYIYIFLYAFFLICYNSQYVNAFMSDTHLWEYSYNKEATPDTTVNLAQYYTKEKKFKEADALIQRAKNWQLNNFNLLPAALNNIYYNSNNPVEKRIERLEHFIPQTSLGFLYLSILYSNNNQSEKVREKLLNVLGDPGSYFMFFSERNEETLALVFVLCEKNGVTGCTESYNHLRKMILMPYWDEKKYNRFYQKFKASQDFLQY